MERTHSWMNGYGKLRRITDRDATIVRFYLYLAAAFVTVRALIQRARHCYRWDARPGGGTGFRSPDGRTRRSLRGRRRRALETSGRRFRC